MYFKWISRCALMVFLLIASSVCPAQERPATPPSDPAQQHGRSMDESLQFMSQSLDKHID